MLVQDDSFPPGVVVKLGQKGGRFTVHWRCQGRTHFVEGESLTGVIHDALQAIKTLLMQGGLL